MIQHYTMKLSSHIKRVLLLVSIIILTVGARSVVLAQNNMGIGTATPDASALLHLSATDKGLLIPIVATTASVTSPATGLLVYHSGTNTFQYNSGTPAAPVWTVLASGAVQSPLTFGSGLTLSGNTVTRATVVMSGDVTGGETATVVERIRGRNIDAATPSNGQVMQWSVGANSWTFATISAGEQPLTFTQGLTRTGNTVTRATIVHSGDVTGGETAMVVERIRGRNVDAATPSNGQVMQWSVGANSWTFATISAGEQPLTFTQGLTRTGNTVTRATIVHSGDVTGGETAMVVERIRGRNVDAAAPSNGQVMQWSAAASSWTFATITAGTAYTAGDGLALTGNQFTLGGSMNATRTITINNLVNLEFLIPPIGTGRVVITAPSSSISGLRLNGLTTTSANTGRVLSVDGSGNVILVNEGGAGGGEANSGVNLGTGQTIYAGKSGVNLQFRSVLAGGNISISTTANDMTISVSGVPTFSGTPDASNRILFETGDNTISSSASLTWDNTNSVLTTERAVLNQTLNVTGATVLHGGVRIGNNGTQLAEIIEVTVNVDIPSVGATSSVTQTFSVPNAQVGSSVAISPAVDLDDGLIISYARVSAAGTVTAKFYNATGVAIDPAAMDFIITIFR